jgi:thiol-disulfide isomerase/thioredoxin
MTRSIELWLALALLLGGCAGATPGGGVPESRLPPPPVTSLADLDGTPHAISAPDRPTVLIFWATWCAPCRAELPELAAAHSRHGARAIFLGVLSGPDRSVDTATARSLTTAAGVTYPQLRDRDGSLARHFGVDGTPTLIVMGPGGEVRYRGHRLPADWESLLSP